MRATSSRVIAIANQKGGVGKTTTAVNLAASLAIAERRCLLIDSDPQGNATTGLGIEARAEDPGLYDFLLAEASLDRVLRPTELPFLHLIPATRDLVGAEVEMASLEDRALLLGRRTSQLRQQFDYVLVDCPPSLGFLTVNALSASDQVLVPLQCEYYAMEGLAQLLNTIQAVRAGLNPGLVLAGILLTMYDVRNNLARQVEAEVRGHFRGQVFKTVVPRNVRLSEAPSHGKPAILYDVRSKGAQAYLALAQEIMRAERTPHG